LAKPCDTAELKKRLTRAFAVRGLLKNPELQGVVSRLQSLPSLPSLFVEVTHELDSKDPSLPRIARLVSEDMAMTAKILQLVNSAFFGLRCRISSPMQAVQMLGLDTLRALVLTTHVFEEFRTRSLGEAEISYLWEHSLAVAAFAKHIAAFEKADRQLVEDCFTAGLLHDAGKLILASAMENKYQHVLDAMRKSGQKMIAAELEILGCSHAEVAAYLLGLWGLPEAVIDGVAWHHAPSGSIQTGFSTAMAAHVATVFHELQSPFWMQDDISLDMECLHKNGLAGREQVWRKLVNELDTSQIMPGKSPAQSHP
jgi:putative nucleotidyltransferase with HDIG domain